MVIFRNYFEQMVRLSQLSGSWHATFSLLALLHTLSVEELPLETFKDLLDFIYEEDMVLGLVKK